MQRTFVLLLVGIFFLLVYWLQPILAPFLVGIALAYLGDPLVDRLERRGVGRTLGVVIVFVIFLAIIALGLLVIVPLLLREVSALISDIPELIRWLQQTTSPLLIKYFNIDPFDIKLDDLRQRLAENWQQTGGIATRILTEVTASGIALVTWLANLVLIPVVAFYLMRDWDRLLQSIQELIPRDIEQTTVRLAKQCDEVLSAFLRGQLLIMFLLGCIYAGGLLIMGLELALLIGMLAGL
ncbi:MAG: AI-2E family transporter, partial [Pseudomonadales bacterium]